MERSLKLEAFDHSRATMTTRTACNIPKCDLTTILYRWCRHRNMFPTVEVSNNTRCHKLKVRGRGLKGIGVVISSF